MTIVVGGGAGDSGNREVPIGLMRDEARRRTGAPQWKPERVEHSVRDDDSGNVAAHARRVTLLLLLLRHF